MIKIVTVRHFEEESNKEYKDISSHIGGTIQGAVRASLMPQLVHKLFGDEEYELHTYTNDVNNVPTSRSYYTVQLLKPAEKKLYSKSSNVDDLIKAVKETKYKNVLICWEHGEFPDIIKGLCGVKTNYDDTVNDLKKKNKKNRIYPTKTFKVATKDVLNIVRSAPEYVVQNDATKMDLVDDSFAYSPIWQFTLNVKSVSVFAGYSSTYDKTTDTWTVTDTSDISITYK
ncbi:MAG: hypothetical protein Edafosvirus1_116 [Edafosvirus sp.]|uniref:Uncharacterized protein n=1 Tax=Edafosvirus sp. TaxID=2487765 RepID=A0A3G4ZSC2_9VIRU|nr:MAG: hypothetical protein Edafosvirus1_116 [Edafosvirus sp.]